MKPTGIHQKIEDMIKLELANLKLGMADANRVWQYRDANFLNGSFDYLFEDYIKDNKLRYE